MKPTRSFKPLMEDMLWLVGQNQKVQGVLML